MKAAQEGAKGRTAPWCMGIVMVCGGWNWRSPGLAGWSALVSKDQVMVRTVESGDLAQWPHWHGVSI